MQYLACSQAAVLSKAAREKNSGGFPSFFFKDTNIGLTLVSKGKRDFQTIRTLIESKISLCLGTWLNLQTSEGGNTVKEMFLKGMQLLYLYWEGTTYFVADRWQLLNDHGKLMYLPSKI